MASIFAYFPPQIQFQKPTIKPVSDNQPKEFVKPNIPQIHKLQTNFLKPSSILQSKKLLVKCSNISSSWNEDKLDDFFKAFVDGVMENLYLETHTHMNLKFQQWKHVAKLSLSSLQVLHEFNEE